MIHLLLTVVLAAAAPPQFEAKTLGGEPITGAIVKLDAQQLTLDTSDGPVPLDCKKLMTLVQKPAPDMPEDELPMRVELVDGSSLAAKQYTVTGGKARITLAEDRVIELPTTGVASVRVMESSDDVAAEWLQIADTPPDADLLVIRKEKAIDYHKGVLADVDEQTVKFNLDGEILPVKRSKVYGLVYCHPQGDALPEAICRITGATGSQWSVSSLALSGELAWTTPAGAKVTSPLLLLSKIDFSSGKVVYLSDLEPDSSEFTPYFGSADDLPVLTKFYAPRNDKNLESAPLSIDGQKTYDKGLSLHSRTQLVYRLPGRFSRFKAVAGIDAGVRPLGHVRLVIHGDDKVLFEADVTGSDPPKPIDLDVTGVRRIAILADFGEKLDVGDHLDLCEARILK
ncbi:MAG: NPCBM/NEW2 domain-containing protein [Candidatus Nealsonbacteria bacterium]|nr:NPCBM/NEW2 domain-containing protein [Candidatus Nealsonbacteria bacterium]